MAKGRDLEGTDQPSQSEVIVGLLEFCRRIRALIALTALLDSGNDNSDARSVLISELRSDLGKYDALVPLTDNKSDVISVLYRQIRAGLQNDSLDDSDFRDIHQMETRLRIKVIEELLEFCRRIKALKALLDSGNDNSDARSVLRSELISDLVKYDKMVPLTYDKSDVISGLYRQIKAGLQRDSLDASYFRDIHRRGTRLRIAAELEIEQQAQKEKEEEDKKSLDSWSENLGPGRSAYAQNN